MTPLTQLFSAGTPASALCHALVVRLPVQADLGALREWFGTAVRRWWPGLTERHPCLWTETVASARGAALAEHRLRTEMHRPVHATGPMLRAVVLTYTDGSRDLVLTAHRATLDPPSLRVVAEMLTGPRDPGQLTAQPAPAAVPAGPPAAEAPVRWGMGDAQAEEHTGVFRVALGDAAGDPFSRLVAAAGVTLGRYEGQRTAKIGWVRAAQCHTPRVLSASDEVGVRTVDLSGARRTHELLTHDDLPPTPGPVVGVMQIGASSAEIACQSALFPLTVILAVQADGTTEVEVRHQTRRIGTAAARAFAEGVVFVHRQLTEHPDGLVRDVRLLDAEAAARQLALGVPPPHTAPRPDRIDTMFDECAARQPDAVALRCGDTAMTYGQLRERADLAAAELRVRGVRPGDRVGICLERSLDLVVTMLAVLKADGVYVPMDPNYPVPRLAFTAKDAGLRAVVTDRPDLGVGCPVLSPAELTGRGRPVVPRRGAGDAAYVIYTSGSTGRPKGVVVPHRNVAALLHATREDFELGPGDTWTLFHSSAFDFSVWEIWGALLTGAALVVVPYDISRSPIDFHKLLVRERVTVLNQTPSAFGQLVEADRHSPQRLAVRLVVFGGEPLDTRILLGWFDRYPEDRCRLVNMFGITETTVHTTAQTVTRRDALAGSRSVGHALPGWTVYVLDPEGQPVPTGVAGEIWVGGAGVASEYLGQPGLTADRFRPDPVSGGRRYRSGDLGRFRPDGSLEHLGRLDHQVKVRGFRIELDEIRTVLLEDPVVTAAAVVLSGDRKDPAGVRIDAYVVLDDPDAEAVRRRAARILPDHMLPSTVTSMDKLPLTTNGKLDRSRLPEPIRAGRTRTVPAPDPGLSRALSGVWESVLGVAVDLDDNFFTLGGNSLYAVRIAAAMRELGLPALPIRQLYLTPTVRALTDALRPPPPVAELGSA